MLAGFTQGLRLKACIFYEGKLKPVSFKLERERKRERAGTELPSTEFKILKLRN